MKLLANLFCGYLVNERICKTVRKLSNIYNMNTIFNCRQFEWLQHVNDAIQEAERVILQIEHKEPAIVWFLILQ